MNYVSAEELLAIKGIGQTFIDKYSEQFISAIKEFKEASE